MLAGFRLIYEHRSRKTGLNDKIFGKLKNIRGNINAVLKRRSTEQFDVENKKSTLKHETWFNSQSHQKFTLNITKSSLFCTNDSLFQTNILHLLIIVVYSVGGGHVTSWYCGRTNRHTVLNKYCLCWSVKPAAGITGGNPSGNLVCGRSSGNSISSASDAVFTVTIPGLSPLTRKYWYCLQNCIAKFPSLQSYTFCLLGI